MKRESSSSLFFTAHSTNTNIQGKILYNKDYYTGGRPRRDIMSSSRAAPYGRNLGNSSSLIYLRHCTTTMDAETAPDKVIDRALYRAKNAAQCRKSHPAVKHHNAAVERV